MKRDDLRAAAYARVSSEQQAKDNTIASQVEALRQRIAQDGLTLDQELCFIDEGWSGSTLIRPALERLRDQAAAGAIDRLYVHSPDRLARKYAYQVLLVDELHRCGVAIVFLNHDLGRSPEEDLLLQVQGMIAEYERAKILERSRRGKRHAAQSGSVNVLSGAPYGYRYISKHAGGGQARYQIILEEARVVTRVFAWVGRERCSIGEVCRRLKREGICTRTGKESWDRTTVWGMLRNAAYKGTAAFGKTQVTEPRPRLRAQRGRPEHPQRPKATADTAPEDPIPILVPAIIDEDGFAAVQEQLAENRRRHRLSARGARYLLQGLLVCKRCGSAFYGKPVSRSSAKGRKRDYAYYRCVGTDAYRFGGHRICWNKQVRTDLLDAAVWEDVRALLADPERIRVEYERRLDRKDCGESREAKQLAALIQRVKRGIARLIDAYEEGLLEKTEFEPRIRGARERLEKLEAEERVQSDRDAEEEALHVVIGQLEEFARRVHDGLQGTDWKTRREIIRALVKRVEVDEEEVRVVYKVNPLPFLEGPERGRLQDCWGRDDSSLRRPLLGPTHSGSPVRVRLEDGGFQPEADQPQDRAVRDPDLQAFEQRIMRDRVEIRLQVRVVHRRQPGGHVLTDRVDRLMGVLARTEPIRAVQEVGLKDRLEDQQHRRLNDPVFDGGNTQRSQPAVRFRDGHAFDRLGPVAFGAEFFVQLVEEDGRARAIDDVLARDAVHSRCSVVLHHQPPRGRQHGARSHNTVKQRGV